SPRGGRRPGPRACVRLGGAGSGLDRGRAAARAPATRRALVADGGAVARRPLLAAGVPIAVPPDGLPLARQPAVVPLLMVLRYAARPDDLDTDAATAL